MRQRHAVLAAGIALLVMNVLPVARAGGQSPSERAVRAAVDSFFAAVVRERWDSAATFLDLPRFDPYFKEQVRIARSTLPRQTPITVDQMMSTDSTMPRAVAEWQAAQMSKRQSDDFSYITSQFAGVRDPHALFALSLPEAAARWIEAQDARTQFRESMRRAGCPVDMIMTRSFLPPSQRILGVAASNDSTMFVVHADSQMVLQAPGSLAGGELVMVLHRAGARWRIEPRHDLFHPLMGFSTDCPKR